MNALGRPLRGALHPQVVLNTQDAHHALSDHLGAPALIPIFGSSGQRDFQIREGDLDFRRIDIRILAETVGNILAASTGSRCFRSSLGRSAGHSGGKACSPLPQQTRGMARS